MDKSFALTLLLLPMGAWGYSIVDVGEGVCGWYCDGTPSEGIKEHDEWLADQGAKEGKSMDTMRRRRLEKARYECYRRASAIIARTGGAPLTPAAIEKIEVAPKLGTKLFGIAPVLTEPFYASTVISAVSRLAIEQLAAVMCILQDADENSSDDDIRFRADEAGNAMIGASVRLLLPAKFAPLSLEQKEIIVAAIKEQAEAVEKATNAARDLEITENLMAAEQVEHDAPIEPKIEDNPPQTDPKPIEPEIPEPVKALEPLREKVKESAKRLEDAGRNLCATLQEDGTVKAVPCRNKPS